MLLLLLLDDSTKFTTARSCIPKPRRLKMRLAQQGLGAAKPQEQERRGPIGHLQVVPCVGTTQSGPRRCSSGAESTKSEGRCTEKVERGKTALSVMIGG